MATIAHCLAGRSHRRLLTDIIAGRCVSGATGNVLVPSEDDVSTGVIPRVRNVCHAYRHHRGGIAASSYSACYPESRPIQIRAAECSPAIEPLLRVANRNAADRSAYLKRKRKSILRQLPSSMSIVDFSWQVKRADFQ